MEHPGETVQSPQPERAPQDEPLIRQLAFLVVDYLFAIDKDRPDEVIQEAIRAVREGASNESLEAILDHDVAPERKITRAELTEIRKILAAGEMNGQG